MDSTTLTQQLRDREVAQALGVSRMTVWRWAKAGLIPQPHKLGIRTTRWDGREVMEVIRKMAE